MTVFRDFTLLWARIRHQELFRNFRGGRSAGSGMTGQIRSLHHADFLVNDLVLQWDGFCFSEEEKSEKKSRFEKIKGLW